MEEEDQEWKYVCKYCFKKYPCGKSLGGHIRSHGIVNSAESDERFDANMRKFDPRFADFVNGQSSYGLRENPRKSWRAVDSTFPLPQERICKQCGKGFHSLKALCGHMACHSDKDRGGLKDDQSWSTSENQKVLMDSHSDTECEDRVIRTRSSKGKKLKKIVIKSSFCSGGGGGGGNNGSSSVSEIDGEEQEEVAMCLMLLSRDSGGNNKGGYVNSVVESSDNNSVILETKSSSIDMRVGKRDFSKNVHDQEEVVVPKEIGDLKLKNSVYDAEIGEMENSDSGYFLDECGKAESEVSVDRFRERVSKIKSYRGGERNEELGKERDEYDNGGTLASRQRLYNAEDCKASPQKKVKYECFNCKKIFKSYQALGGHRPCHKKSNAYYESRYESGENSLDDSTEFTAKGKVVESGSNRKSSAKNIPDKKNKAKKNKGHVCPFCNRVFKNGQALGGHKRSHFIGGHEVNHNPSPIPKPDLLDLNLPAPQEDDDDDGNHRFSSW